VPEHFRCGLVAVIGRPNVGKSTLVNRLVGCKVSIISRKPQTTRARVMGIRTNARSQVIYIDTPGLHVSEKNLLNRYMNRAARGSMEAVDCIVLIIAATGWTRADDYVVSAVQQQQVPVILTINKIDQLKGHDQLLPLIQDVSARMNFAEIVPLSALTGENVTDLESTILRYLPEQPAIFPEDQVSDRDQRFMAAELVREQIFHVLREEVPYAVGIGIERFERRNRVLHVEAVIWVQKITQKGILIGKGGERLKSIGTRARVEMEKLFNGKVHLELWVKVREGWVDSDALLRSLQYGDD
jgi:GTP-binding protein Era